MKCLYFARRTGREILRDPLSLAFGLGFPVVLLGLLSAIQANIPVPLFEIGHLTPGITVFGLSFLTLFSATVVARDRGSALLQRLYTTPMTAGDFIGGYLLPLIPMALGQGLVCYGVALVLGLELSLGILWAILGLLPVSLFFIGLGLLCGSVFSEKQVGGICGAMLTNVGAFLSGAWFDLELAGDAIRGVAYCLPFAHAVDLERALLLGDRAGIFPHLWWVLGYGLAAGLGAVGLFLRQMNRQ